jgi:hypothetical protein
VQPTDILSYGTIRGTGSRGSDFDPKLVRSLATKYDDYRTGSSNCCSQMVLGRERGDGLLLNCERVASR